MNFPSRGEVERMRQRYPKGTKIVVDMMEDPQAVPSGTVGTVSHVDDMNQIHCKEFGLALIPGVDSFHKI